MKYALYNLDFSMAEKYCTIYFGNVRKFLKALAEDKCIHCLTGADFSGKSYEKVFEENAKKVLSSLGNGTRTWRYWGKSCNYQMDYGEGEPSLALILGIPLTIARQMHFKYHSSYPEIRGNFWRQIQEQLLEKGYITNLLGRRIYNYSDLSHKTFYHQPVEFALLIAQDT